MEHPAVSSRLFHKTIVILDRGAWIIPKALKSR